MSSNAYYFFSLICISIISITLTYKYSDIEIYMDEIFHVPQGIEFCKWNFHMNSKITTFPGLYIFSTIIYKCLVHVQVLWNYFVMIFNLSVNLNDVSVTPYLLRNSNLILGFLLSFDYSMKCRQLLYPVWNKAGKYNDSLVIAWCIVLYPIHFFYMPLYYTDTLSTACLIVTYYYSLLNNNVYNSKNKDIGTGIVSNSMWSVFFYSMRLCIVACICVGMRQTNVIWLCFFMGTSMIELLVRSGIIKSTDTNPFTVLFKLANAPIVALQTVLFSRSAFMSIYPLLVPIVAFLYFVFGINAGHIVLGDRENHVPTLHTAMVVHCVFILSCISLLLEETVELSSSYPYVKCSAVSRTYTTVVGENNPNSPKVDAHSKYGFQLFGRLVWLCVCALVLGVFIQWSLVASKNNPHPFLLADNRHYMFYIWKRILSRESVICTIYKTAVSSRLGFGLDVGVNPVSLTNVYTVVIGYFLLKRMGYGGRCCSGDGRDCTTNGLWYIIYTVAIAITLLPTPLLEVRYFTPAVVMYLLNCSQNQTQTINISARYSNNKHDVKQIEKPVINPYLTVCGTIIYVVSCMFMNVFTVYIFLYKPFALKTIDGNEELGRFMY